MTPLRRLLFGAFGLLEFGWGLWAYLAPHHFFVTFPGGGYHWTAGYPPYNAHLVADLGATFLTLGVLLLTAAWLDDRRVSTVVVVAEVLFAALHLLFHVRHRGTLGADYGLSLLTLVLGVLVPPLVLLTYRRA